MDIGPLGRFLILPLIEDKRVFDIPLSQFQPAVRYLKIGIGLSVGTLQTGTEPLQNWPDGVDLSATGLDLNNFV